jgi:ABC-type multidrug transport system fused ATPase/permease subunit
VARLRREVEARIQSHVQRTLRNIPVVKAFAQEDRERERFEEFADEAIRVHKRGALAMGLFDLGGGFAPAFGTAAVLWFGALLVMDGQLTLGALLVFLAYLTTLQGQFRNLLAVYGTVQNTGASLERVMEVLEAEEEVEERPAAVELGRCWAASSCRASSSATRRSGRCCRTSPWWWSRGRRWRWWERRAPARARWWGWCRASSTPGRAAC